MNKKMLALLFVLVIASGFVGGYVASYVLASKVSNTGEAIQDGVLAVKELKIVDGSGNTKIWMTGKDGKGLIFMYEEGSNPRMSLSADKDGGFIQIYSGLGIMECKASMGVGESGGYISTVDRYGVPDPR